MYVYKHVCIKICIYTHTPYISFLYIPLTHRWNDARRAIWRASSATRTKIWCRRTSSHGPSPPPLMPRPASGWIPPLSSSSRGMTTSEATRAVSETSWSTAQKLTRRWLSKSRHWSAQRRHWSAIEYTVSRSHFHMFVCLSVCSCQRRLGPLHRGRCGAGSQKVDTSYGE